MFIYSNDVDPQPQSSLDFGVSVHQLWVPWVNQSSVYPEAYLWLCQKFMMDLLWENLFFTKIH